jgi:hypothetical protein
MPNSNNKVEQARLAQEAADRIGENVSFDFKSFLDQVGPAPSFQEPLGPTQGCLSVDVIRSFHVGQMSRALRSGVEAHLTVCQVCAELVESYSAPQTMRMPESLFQRISGRRPRATETPIHTPRNWFPIPAAIPAVRWLTAATVALVLLWALYPAKPYFDHLGSKLNDAWLAFRTGNITIPNDTQEADAIVKKLIQDSNRGETPAPRQIEQLLSSVTAKSLTSPDDPRFPVWTTYRTQLTAVDALSHYEVLRRKTSSDIAPVWLLQVSEIGDFNGVPAITVDSNQVANEKVREALVKSAEQSGISRLFVFQGDKLIYDLVPPDGKHQTELHPVGDAQVTQSH